MPRRFAFPLLALAIAGLLLLFEDRLFPPAPKPPPPRPTEPAPDPRSFDMAMKPATPAAPDTLLVLDSVDTGLALRAERPDFAAVPDPRDREALVKSYGANVALRWHATRPSDEWRFSGWIVRVRTRATPPLPDEQIVVTATKSGTPPTTIEITVRPAVR